MVMDCDDCEVQCVDQILHLAVDKDFRVHGIEQSSCNFGLMKSQFMQTGNVQKIIKPKIKDLDKQFGMLI